MATIVRIDEMYLNLNNVTVIEVDPDSEKVTVDFLGNIERVTLKGEQGARLLRWLDAGGRTATA